MTIEFLRFKLTACTCMTVFIDRRTGTNFAPRKREMCIYV